MIELLSCGTFSFPKTPERTNQDSALLPLRLGSGYLMAVADGVGSYIGAENASRIATSLLSGINTNQSELDITGIFYKIREEITALSAHDKSLKDAATTLTLCHMCELGIRIGHIGDCRLYIRNDSRLIQKTKDHTQYQKLLDEGIYNARELRNSHTKNVLFTALSRDSEIQLQETFLPYNSLDLKNGEVDIFIMSDGAYHFWEKRPRFSPSTIINPNRFAASLHKRIEKFGAVDDYTLIAAKFKIPSIASYS